MSPVNKMRYPGGVIHKFNQNRVDCAPISMRDHSCMMKVWYATSRVHAEGAQYISHASSSNSLIVHVVLV